MPLCSPERLRNAIKKLTKRLAAFSLLIAGRVGRTLLPGCPQPVYTVTNVPIAEIELGNPPVVNDPALYGRMLPSLQRVTRVHDITPQTVAEDFSFFSNEVPGLFLFLGNGPPDVDPTTLPGNHSPYFDMYEPNLEMGVRIFSNLVVDYLNR